MKKITLIMASMLLALVTFGQQFEAEKINKDDFTDVGVKVGGDFAIQLQYLDHSAPNAAVVDGRQLVDIKHNVNLPTANFSMTADLAPGIQLYLNTFLSSRHHNEAWVEGGYMTIDNLPFLPALDDVMQYFTIKVGVFNPNYGDAHFYRSNNGAATKNPFVGNWIMDDYTTNPGMEVTFRSNGFLAMVGTNNGRLNYGRGTDIGNDLNFNWKLAYDTQVNDDVRLRAAISAYYVPDGNVGSYLWGGDRAGARYYDVMLSPDQGLQDAANRDTGQFSPGGGQSQMDTYQFNIFADLYGLELFGMYDNMHGIKRGNDQHFTQSAIQAIYRVGSFYLGTRLNKVDDHTGNTVTRTNIGGGWFMTPNVVVKLDHVVEKYEGSGPFQSNSPNLDGGKFHGVVIEAAVSF